MNTNRIVKIYTFSTPERDGTPDSMAQSDLDRSYKIKKFCNSKMKK